MRIRQIKDVAPIHLLPGDTLAINYTDERGYTETLLEDVLTERRVIDRIAVVELTDKAQLKELSMSEALGAIVGKHE